jgi:hypothetical protein
VAIGALGALDAAKINKAEVNLKAYVRLNLEADVRVIAKVKGENCHRYPLVGMHSYHL